MKPWEMRSPDVAAMLNPALIAMVTAGAASEFTRISGDPFPFAYAFLVSPLVLDHDTREALPRRTDSHLTKWASEHPVLTGA